MLIKGRFGHCITFDTGNSVGEISGQSNVINSVSIRQQRPYRAATASDDQTIVFYHGTPFKFNTLHKGLHSNFVHGVAFSPDGTYFVSVGADRKIFLFDGKDGSLKTEIKDEAGHKGSILSVSWSPDSKRFVTASADQSVKLWDAVSQKLLKTWSFGTPGSIPNHQVGVVFTPRSDGLIISLSLAGDFNYLTESSDAPARVVSGHQNPLTALTLTNSKSLLTGSTEGRVCSWDLSTGTSTVISGAGHTNVIAGLVEASKDAVTSVGWDDKLRFISTSSNTFTPPAIPTDAQPKGIARLSADKLVVLTLAELRIYTITQTSEPTLLTSSKLDFTPTALAVHTHIAVAGQDSSVRIFNLTPSSGEGGKLNLITVLSASRGFGTALAYSPSGRYFALGESSGLIALYAVSGADDTYSRVSDRWAFHTARVESIDWNPAGTHVVSGSLDTNLYVYSAEKPSRNAKFRNAHMGGISGVRWEAGGTVVVSVGNDQAVKRWNVVVPV
jgi:WD40 repeat protein